MGSSIGMPMRLAIVYSSFLIGAKMYFISFIVMVSVFSGYVHARRVGGPNQNINSILFPTTPKIAVSPLAPSISSKVVKEDIVARLDSLLQSKKIDESWYETINDLVFELATLDKNLSTIYLKKIIAKTSIPTVKETPIYPPKQSTADQKESLIVSKDILTKKLEGVLHQQITTDGWYDTVNNLIMELSLIDRDLSNIYFKKILDKIARESEKKTVSLAPPITPEKSHLTPEKKANTVIDPLKEVSAVKKTEEAVQQPVEKGKEAPTLVPPTQSDNNAKKEIEKKLDDLLQQKMIDELWYTGVNNLIFDLAVIDRNLSNEYLKKVRQKTVTIPVKIVSPALDSESVQKNTPAISPLPPKNQSPQPREISKGSPPPPPPSGGIAKGGIPLPPNSGVKKGTPPPPPGPMVKGAKATPAAKGKSSPVISPKGPDPLTIRESYGAKQLEKRTNEEVIELFNKLLEALGTYTDFWDAVQKKPKLDWENKINTVKKTLVDPKRNISIDAAKAIADRIVQVRTDKAKEGLAKQAMAEKKEEEKEREEFSESELIAKIESLKKREKVNEMNWLIEFQGNIKKLDKVNHEKALSYQNEFIKKFTGQRPFLPKRKPIEVK